MDLKKKILYFSISTAIILTLFYFSDLNNVLNTLRRADLMLFGLAIFFGFSQLFLWSVNWSRILSSAGADLSMVESLNLQLSGHFVNSITPLAQFGGEPFMAKLVSDRSKLSYHESISAVFSVDLINNLAPPIFLVFGFLYTYFFESLATNSSIIRGIYTGLGIMLIGILGAYLLWSENKLLKNFFIKTNHFLTSITRLNEKTRSKIDSKIEEAFKIFKKIGDDKKSFLGTAVIAQFAFLAEVACMYFILLSLNVEPDLSLLYILMPLSAIADFSPTPGGLGAYEAAMTGLLAFLFPVNLSVAFSATLLFRIATYWQGLILGYAAINS